jgi:DNA-nicking Smr family endonuclease
MCGKDEELFQEAMGRLGLGGAEQEDASAWNAYAESLKEPLTLPTGQAPQQADLEVKGSTKSRDDMDAEVFLEAMKELREVEARAVPAREGKAPTLQTRGVYRALKQGKLSPDALIDLHGLTRDTALEALIRFLSESSQRGHKLVLIVCGKGLHSAQRAVLKEALPGWLNGPLKRYLLESFEAPKRLGGSGAWIAVLKRLKKNAP